MDFIFDMFKNKYQKKGINSDNDVDKIVEVWKEADFIGEVDENDVTNLALSYDSALRYVINNELNPFLQNIIFPLTRYIYLKSNINKPIESKIVCKILKKTPVSLFVKYVKNNSNEETVPIKICEGIEKICTEQNLMDKTLNEVDYNIFFDLKTELWSNNIDAEAELANLIAKYIVYQFLSKQTILTKLQVSKEEVIDRWSKFGFIINSYDDNEKLALAQSYENMAYTILSDERFNMLYFERNWFELVVFPIITRVVSMRYALNNNEVEPIDPQKIISFFENTTIGDVFETQYPVINVDCSNNCIITDEKSVSKCLTDRLVAKACFDDLFKIISKDMPLIKFNFNSVDKNIIKSYNLDIEAIFVAMISSLLYHKLYVKE